LKDDDEATWKTYARARRACKRFVMRKKKELWAKFMAKIEDAYENDHKELWRLVKRLAPTGTKVSVAPVRDAAGELAKSEEAILDVWGVYQKNGYRLCRHSPKTSTSTRKAVPQNQTILGGR
jgi:hypothetical protein